VAPPPQNLDSAEFPLSALLRPCESSTHNNKHIVRAIHEVILGGSRFCLGPTLRRRVLLLKWTFTQMSTDYFALFWLKDACLDPCDCRQDEEPIGSLCCLTRANSLIAFGYYLGIKQNVTWIKWDFKKDWSWNIFPKLPLALWSPINAHSLYYKHIVDSLLICPLIFLMTPWSSSGSERRTPCGLHVDGIRGSVCVCVCVCIVNMCVCVCVSAQ